MNINVHSMKRLYIIIVTLLCCMANDGYANPVSPNCPRSKEATLQILGSGGPIADDGRASTGYLVWINGKSRFLIDAGGGVFLRFGEAGARFEDLDHIAISHFHTDHSTDLVALLKSAFFTNRTKPLPITGPAAGSGYPGTGEHLDSLLNPDHGAWAYLGGYLDGSDQLIRLESSEIDFKLQKASEVYADPTGDIRLLALGVPHGPVPALAYRLNVGQQSIVFAGDQNGSSESFIDFARGTDVLVMHMPVPENITGTGRILHAPPSKIGNIAAETGSNILVLSHFMARSLYNLEENLKVIRSRYTGSLVVAQDLDCVNL